MESQNDLADDARFVMVGMTVPPMNPAASSAVRSRSRKNWRMSAWWLDTNSLSPLDSLVTNGTRIRPTCTDVSPSVSFSSRCASRQRCRSLSCWSLMVMASRCAAATRRGPSSRIGSRSVHPRPNSFAPSAAFWAAGMCLSLK